LEPTSETMTSERGRYDHRPLALNGRWHMTNLRFGSSAVVAAYKVAFAIMYDLRIELPV
jgi:hypothetical protein